MLVNRPNFSTTKASRIAGERFDISAAVKELPSYRDQNFYLQTNSGEEYVLKIANPDEDKEALDLQNKAMEFLAGSGYYSKRCPTVISTTSGESISEITGDDNRHYDARLLTFLPGRRMVELKRHSPELLLSLGRFCGELDKALLDFSHPAMWREHNWDIKQASPVLAEHLDKIENPRQRKLVENFLTHFEQNAVPLFPELRSSVIHNDANDHNVLLTGQLARKVGGIIDFGDIVHTFTVAELAIAAAYAMLDKRNPLRVAARVIQGYNEAFELSEPELAVLFDFICIRLCTSVTMAAHQKKLDPDNSYLTVNEKPAWALLEWLATMNPRFAHYTFRDACKRPPCPRSFQVIQWLEANKENIGPVCEQDLKTAPTLVFDLSVGSLEIPSLNDLKDVSAFTQSLFDKMKAAEVDIGIGRYNEARLLYTSDQFAANDDDCERRTIHLGIDLFMKAGSPIFAPLDGVVHSLANNAEAQDYGPTIILQHEIPETEQTFFTLYGHLSKDSLAGLQEGMPIKKGDRLAKLGTSDVNGGWPPHLHFQIMTDILDEKGNFPGVAAPRERNVWLSICPNPNLILEIPEDSFPPADSGRNATLQARKERISGSLSISYKRPLKIVRGWMQYLYDHQGRQYLDAVNNVPHVGHSHPTVVKAVQEQMAILNTNTRYLHDNLGRYAQRLCDLLPASLDVCFFVNSGSEANDLALRLARAHTHATDIIVVDGAYHGNLSALIDISPYKFDGPGGSGAPSYVHKVMMPDIYRGPHKASDVQAGEKYALAIKESIAQIQEHSKKLAGFIHESLLGCGGQIVLPANYLKEAYAHIREAGGVCIADEVQVGFGRVGSYFWGFETQGVVPDIVTLGKPIGNGHPLGAVVTTPEIAASFDTGMEYFNTYGGNPVSCAAGLAVLEVIADEKLQENALDVGEYLKEGLLKLKGKHALIGDVRGLGLFVGIELVRDHENLDPASQEAALIVERMKQQGVLVSTDGPLHNVIKIKPPLCFDKQNAEYLVKTLDMILDELE